MRLLSLGSVTPLGATLKEHVMAPEGALEKKIDFQEYVVAGKKRKIAVHRARDPQLTLPVPDAVLRRMGLSTKLVLSSIEEAKQRVTIDFANKKVGLIVGTTQGPSSTNIDYFRKLVSFQYRGASPNLFAQSVHNNIASSTALTYSWKGPTVTLVQESNLLSSAVTMAKVWLEQKSADYVWMILGNEMSMHLPYIQLFEHVSENPEAEQFISTGKDISYEAFSSFLLSANPSEGVADFELGSLKEILTQSELKKDRMLSKPELLGVALAEHFYKKYF